MSIFGILVEGGQTWAHRIRMLRQVFKLAITISIVVSSVVFLGLMLSVHFGLYQAAWYYTKANTVGSVFQTVEVDPDFWERIANERSHTGQLEIQPEKISAYTGPYVDILLEKTTQNIKHTSTISSITLITMLTFFLIRGTLSKGKKHVSGRRFVAAWRIMMRLKLTGKASKIRLGKLPLLKGTETQHIMINGGTGSGKTNCMHHILPQIRLAKQRAIIVDTTGAFVERYFREGKDVLLNPFDKRSASWHPWAECNNNLDIEELAECFIPSSHSEHDDYWRNAARSVFSALIQKVQVSKRASDLTRWMLFEPLTSLCVYVKGTKAAAHLDVNSEKTAASVRSVLANFLSCFEFLQDTEDPFSIHDWMQNGKDDQWLFLACTPEQRASIRPLLSCWFAIATRSLIQMQPDLNRRVWFIVDELPSLNKLKDLETFLTESRKYGGCALLAMQSLAQLDIIYGKDIAKTIVGNCATKIAFSEQHPEIADKISRAFGQQEIKEYQEGISYGAHETRDSVSLSRQTKTLPLISVTAIQSLKRNQAFIKLPENLPITKIKLSIAN